MNVSLAHQEVKGSAAKPAADPIEDEEEEEEKVGKEELDETGRGGEDKQEEEEEATAPANIDEATEEIVASDERSTVQLGLLALPLGLGGE